MQSGQNYQIDPFTPNSIYKTITFPQVRLWKSEKKRKCLGRLLFFFKSFCKRTRGHREVSNLIINSTWREGTKNMNDRSLGRLTVSDAGTIILAYFYGNLNTHKYLARKSVLLSLPQWTIIMTHHLVRYLTVLCQCQTLDARFQIF